MESRNSDTGADLVLDNRKLILGFVLLVALCGGCFVIGFMEGKRQAIQAKIEALSPPPAAADKGATQAAPGSQPPSATGAASAAKDQNVRDQLEWYKNVQRGETVTAKPAPSQDKVPPAPAPERSEPKPPAPSTNAVAGPETGVPAAKVSYSVQVGAFRQLKEAETRAASVRAKGFECAIEPQGAANPLYLVKVGPYKSKADAVAMQHKLTKAGFSCFLKTN